MNTTPSPYARCIEASRRARWEIDRDVIRGRRFDLDRKFLPDGLSRVEELSFLSASDQRYLSQVQGRTYANLFGVIERFISAEIVDLSREHRLSDQDAFESLVRFCDEELKHQELFRRIEQLAGEAMPAGYACVADPDDVARLVLAKSAWAQLGLTCHIELFTLLHYKESIRTDAALSELFRDVFRFHWREEAQHAVIDELEWRRVDAGLDQTARDAAVEDLIALVTALDGILQAQAAADASFFASTCGRELTGGEAASVAATVLDAYRWQYVGSGLTGSFRGVLSDLLDERQMARVEGALAPLL